MSSAGAPQCVRRRSFYPVDDGRSVEIVMTSGSSGGRRKQECVVLLISIVVGGDSNRANGSPGTIRGRTIQVMVLVAYLLVRNHKRVGLRWIAVVGRHRRREVLHLAIQGANA